MTGFRFLHRKKKSKRKQKKRREKKKFNKQRNYREGQKNNKLISLDCTQNNGI